MEPAAGDPEASCWFTSASYWEYMATPRWLKGSAGWHGRAEQHQAVEDVTPPGGSD